MQSPPFGIISINNNNPRHACNPPPKPRQQQRQLAPIPVMNPTNSTGWHGGEGGEGGEGKQSTRGTKKSRAAFTGDSPHPPHRSNEAGETLPSRVNDVDNDDNVFMDTSKTPRDEVESEGEEGAPATAPVAKKHRVATPIVLVAVEPFYSHPFITTTPRTYHREQPSLSRSGYCEQPKRKTQGKNLRCSIW